jgi:hypothetical protein
MMLTKTDEDYPDIVADKPYRFRGGQEVVEVIAVFPEHFCRNCSKRLMVAVAGHVYLPPDGMFGVMRDAGVRLSIREFPDPARGNKKRSRLCVPADDFLRFFEPVDESTWAGHPKYTGKDFDAFFAECRRKREEEEAACPAA